MSNRKVVSFTIMLNMIFSGLLISSSPLFLQEATAEQREYEVEKYDENLTIPSANIGYMTFNLEEDKEYEIVYTVQVKEGLPIDLWFVNEDNYMLFVNDAQYYYYVDGSEQEVIYTTKIIKLREPDVYILIMANYNNQTVEVNIICELRTYHGETSEPSSWDPSIFLYPLLLAVLILAVLLFILFVKTRRYKKAKPKVSTKTSRKKSKPRKPKKTKSKIKKDILKKSEALESEEARAEISEREPSEKTRLKGSDKVSPGFCGFCGKPVETPYCIHCGQKV